MGLSHDELKSPRKFSPNDNDTDSTSDEHNSYVNLLYGATTGTTILPLSSNEFNMLNNTTKSSHRKRDISLNRFLSLEDNSCSNGIENILLNNNNNNNISPNVISSNITIRQSRNSGSQNRINNNNNNVAPTAFQTVHSNTSINQQQSINSQHNILLNSSLERKKNQKKNTTSDSNVKLLADHNFYHVTNRNNNGFVQNPIQPPTISSSSSTSSSLSNKTANFLNEKNEELFKNMLFNNSTNMVEVSKPYELSDFYKYSTRYRNSNSSTGSGSTTNTNTLLMINTAVNNNNYENNEQVQKLQIHSTPNETGSQILQSKYSGRNLNTPPSSSSATLYDSLQYLHMNGTNGNINNSPKCYPQLSHNNSINDITTSASNATNNNSISLNLSIHTAEEFGKEMLAWLQSEHKRNNSSSSLAHHHIHITTNSNDAGTATTAATLV